MDQSAGAQKPEPGHPEEDACAVQEKDAAPKEPQSPQSPLSQNELPSLQNSQNATGSPATRQKPQKRSPNVERTIETTPLARSAYQYLHISGPADQSPDSVDRRFRGAVAASKRAAAAREAQWTAAQERARIAEEADERAKAEREAEHTRLLEKRREENREIRLRVRERQRDLEAKTRAVRKPKASYSPAAVAAELRAEREQGAREEDYRTTTLGELRARATKSGTESPPK